MHEPFFEIGEKISSKSFHKLILQQLDVYKAAVKIIDRLRFWSDYKLVHNFLTRICMITILRNAAKVY